MQLYPFQQDVVTDVLGRVRAGKRRLLVVSPTGTGKTHLICALAMALQRSVLVVVHRVELLHQTVARFKEFGIEAGVIHGTRSDIRQITIGMAQTIRSRGMQNWAVAIIDEAHRDEHKLIHAHPCIKIGFTATPVRVKGSLADWYDEMIVAITYSQAIADGRIVPARVWAPTIPDLTGINVRAGDYAVEQLGERMAQRKLVAEVVDNWLKTCPTEKTVVFATNTTHAQRLYDEFQRTGLRIGLVLGNTPAAERAMIMHQFRLGVVRVVVNVAVYIEGLDVGDASCIIIARPTRSLSFWMQMAGRGCRPFPGKAFYRVLDHSGNVFEWGSPSQDRDWGLTHDNEHHRRKNDADKGVRYCRKCFFVFTGSVRTCPNCEAPSVPKDVVAKKGELVEVKPEAYEPIAGFMSLYEKRRRAAFAMAAERKIPRSATFAFVSRTMRQEVAIQLRDGKQLIIPADPLLLF